MRFSLRQLIVYPSLFAILPVVNLYLVNRHLLLVSAVLGYLVLIFVSVMLVYWLLRWRLKTSSTAGLLTLTLAVAVFYYGTVYDGVGKLADRLSIVTFLTDHRVLLLVWGLILAFLVVLILRKRFTSQTADSYLNLFSIAVVGVALSQFLIGPPTVVKSSPHQEGITPGKLLGERINLNGLPDVYYIILDGYGRQDVLKDYYDFDNSEFINNLTQRGFYVAPASRSNYSETKLSLASSLNMDYLDALGLITENLDSDLRSAIQNNRVMQEFDQQGYETITLHMGYVAGKYTRIGDETRELTSLGEFDIILLRSTILRPILSDFVKADRRAAIMDGFARLKAIASDDRPTFVYAHFVVPHPPFLFDEEGGMDQSHSDLDDNRWLPKDGYVNGVRIANQQVESLIDSLLSRPGTPPIIIVQGDHGPASDYMRPRERMPNLNAYYLPGGGEQYLYPDITPVNTFRLILDLYFKTQFGLLDDRSLFVDYEDPYDFCEAQDAYHDSEGESAWIDRPRTWLAGHDYRLVMNDCSLFDVLPIHDGWTEVIDSFHGEFLRWAGPSLHLRLPAEPNKNYVLRLNVDNTFSNQDLKLIINGYLLTTITLPSGRQEIEINIPAEKIGDLPFVNVEIDHSQSSIISTDPTVGPRELSMMYYWLEWRPQQS